MGSGSFAGHWGWQHHLEAAGWTALEEDGPAQPLHAEALAPWPQQHDPEQSCTLVQQWRAHDTFWGPRSHSVHGNLHAFLVAGDPPVETYAPWAFSSDPYDTARLWRCHPAPARLE